MYRFLCVVLMAVAVIADTVDFKDCGMGEVKKIAVTKCSGELCILHKGETNVFEMNFAANQDSKTAEIDLTAKVDDRVVQVPLQDTNACNYTSCPIKSGDSKVLLYKLTIPPLSQDFDAYFTAKINGTNGLLACATVHVQIEK